MKNMLEYILRVHFLPERLAKDGYLIKRTKICLAMPSRLE